MDAESALERIGKPAGKIAWETLQGVGDDEASARAVADLKKEAGVEGDEVERLLLRHAAQQALPQIESLPLEQSVRELLDKELRQLSTSKGSLVTGSYLFNRAAKIATLRRFPAGPLEWETSGIPRSFLLQASFPATLRLLEFVTFQLGGWSPCLFTHTAPPPMNRALTVPKQVLRCYHRIARTLELQPEKRGIVAHAWFHDPAALRDHPHLATLNEPFLQYGGFIVTLAAAPATSGVIERNAQRKTDYEAGKIQYKYGLAIWPRSAAIEWAKAHPELAE